MTGPFAAAATARKERGPFEAILAWFLWFGKTPWARRAILVANAGGIAYGFWYYRFQFAETPWWTWPLVPDSPLAVLWASAALLLWGAGRRSPALEGLAFTGNVVIGFWTAFVLLYYDRVHWPRLDFILFWLHLAMAGLALVFVARLRWGPRRDAVIAVLAALAWYTLNVLADYAWTGYTFQGCAGLHPITIHPPGDPCRGLDVVAWFTAGLTALTVGTLAVLTLGRRR